MVFLITFAVLKSVFATDPDRLFPADLRRENNGPGLTRCQSRIFNRLRPWLSAVVRGKKIFFKNLNRYDFSYFPVRFNFYPGLPLNMDSFQHRVHGPDMFGQPGVNSLRHFFFVGMGGQVAVIGHFQEVNGFRFTEQSERENFPETAFGGITDDALLFFQVFLEEFPQGLKGVFKTLDSGVPDYGGKGFPKDILQGSQGPKGVVVPQV
jgi:hypothetical protein